MTERTGRRALLGRTYRRRLVGCILLGLLVGVAAWFFGVDLGHAIGLGAVALAASACVSLIGDQPRVDWAPDPAMPRDGARRDVVQLGWALHTRGGAVAPEAVRRLRTLAAQVLDLHGLDLDDPAHRPAIEAVLGGDLLRILRRGTAESPKLGTYRAALVTLERVAESPPGPLAPTEAPAESNKENTDAR
ncbi:hypothetical protein [Leifsonia poae]|uniref:hypothetical protein n=1 Tax=Leifsonia poae TaxID=110933 RepID=UPI003D66BF48